MNALVAARRDEIERICPCHCVHRLELFGSATGSAFDAACNDLDFLVAFAHPGPEGCADVYFGLWEDLERRFARATS